MSKWKSNSAWAHRNTRQSVSSSHIFLFGNLLFSSSQTWQSAVLKLRCSVCRLWWCIVLSVCRFLLRFLNCFLGVSRNFLVSFGFLVWWLWFGARTSLTSMTRAVNPTNAGEKMFIVDDAHCGVFYSRCLGMLQCVVVVVLWLQCSGAGVFVVFWCSRTGCGLLLSIIHSIRVLVFSFVCFYPALFPSTSLILSIPPWTRDYLTCGILSDNCGPLLFGLMGTFHNEFCMYISFRKEWRGWSTTLEARRSKKYWIWHSCMATSTCQKENIFLLQLFGLSSFWLDNHVCHSIAGDVQQTKSNHLIRISSRMQFDVSQKENVAEVFLPLQ